MKTLAISKQRRKAARAPIGRAGSIRRAKSPANKADLLERMPGELGGQGKRGSAHGVKAAIIYIEM